MKRMTTIAILIFAVTQISNAGWLSSIGQRIVNGAVNTVQTNISSKVNRTIDNAMDGKLAPQKKNSSQSHVDNYSGQPGLPTQGVSAGGPTSMIENQVDSSGMLSLEQVRKRALPFKGVYEEIDLGTFKFRGERLYGASLVIGEQMKAMDFYLMPGLYMFCFIPKSYNANVSVVGKHEGEGVELGYGLKTRKSIEDIGFYEMNLNKGTTIRIVEASKNGGHFEMAMFNDASKMGAMEFTVFKIPDTTLK
jgi:hypothetical protein